MEYRGNQFYLVKVRNYNEITEYEEEQGYLVHGENYVEAVRAIVDYFGSDLYGFSIEDIIDTEYNVLSLEDDMYAKLKERNE